MKLLRCLAVILILLTGIIPSVVLAGPSADVVITATPMVTTGISNFTITYTSHTQMDLSWSYSALAVQIMIRAKYGGYPADIPDEDTAPTDGYLVYYGAGVAISDTSMDFDQNPGPLYYKAWGQKATGKWYVTTSTGWKESTGMVLLTLALLAISLTIAMFLSRNAMLGFPCVIFWVILGAYAYTLSTTPWGDWQYFLFFGSFGMAIFCAFAAFGLREQKDTGTDEDEFIDEKGGDKEQYYGEIKEQARRANTDDFPSDDIDSPPKPSVRTRMLHKRANERKTGADRPKRRFRWGEFK